MADEQESMSDSELFQSAVADEPVAEPERDELGRFAPKDEAKTETPVEPKAETVAAEPGKAPTAEPDDNAANVPSWRLREVREAREAAERRADEATQRWNTLQAQFQAQQAQLQSLQKPKEPVDFFADPDNALKQNIDPLRSEFQSGLADIRLEMSRELAVIKHGEPAVKEMEAAIQQAMQANHPDVPSLAARMRNSKNPAAVAMDWHKNQTLVKETGGDLNAYKERLRGDLLKDPDFLAKALEAARTQAGTAGRPAIQLPPSLSKVAGSGNSSTTDDGDMSDRALFKQAIRR